MKRIKTLTASHPSQSRRVYGLPYMMLALLVIINSPILTNAQSKDRANPTPLTSNEISGMVDSDTRGSIFYYSFMAGPGEVSITLTVEPGRKLDDSDFSYASVGVHLFDRNAELITSKQASASAGAAAGQAVARADVARRQPVVLQVVIGGMNGRGRYRVQINGAVEVGQSRRPSGGIRPVPPSGPNGTYTEEDLLYPEKLNEEIKKHLPKRGTLLIKMKDGSERRIDLSQVEEVKVEH